MIAKKTKTADLEKKRFAFFQIGLILAGAITLVAFEYTTVEAEKKKIVSRENISTWGPQEEIPVEIVERPIQPQPRSSFQMEPDEEVTITQRTSGDPVVFTKIFIEDPCVDCETTTIFFEKDPKALEDPLIDAQISPSFPGGEEAMMKFVYDNIQIPQINQEMGRGGLVYVNFVINTDGSVTEVKGESKDANIELIKASENVIKKMPNWIPGENFGKKVRVRFTIPINVKIG